MNQSRKDERDMPNRQSNMEKSEGSRETGPGPGQERGGSTESKDRDRSVLDDQEAFEHGSSNDSVARGMGAGERSGRTEGEPHQGGGISNRGKEREQREQDQLPERGRSQSER